MTTCSFRGSDTVTHAILMRQSINMDRAFILTLQGLNVILIYTLNFLALLQYSHAFHWPNDTEISEFNVKPEPLLCHFEADFFFV